MSNNLSGKSSDSLATLLANFTAVTMIAHHVAGKATRDTLFLTLFKVDQLPKMMAISAAISVIAVLWMSRYLTRLGPAVLMPRFFIASGLVFLLEWLWMAYQPRAVAAAIYIHISVFGGILISGFWSVINERFDPYSAKKTIARLAAAATLGGLVGGFAAKFIADATEVRSILLMLGGMHLACGVALWLISRECRRSPEKPAEPGFLLGPLKSNVLIRRMALLVTLVAMIVALLDFLMKSRAAESLDEQQLISFFSYFYMAVGVGGFLLQSSVGEKALHRLGLGGTIAILPVMIMVGGVVALLFRHLLSAAILRGGTALLINSFYRAGFETLYTPIPAADKRSTKILIDVGVESGGEMLGSGLIMLVLLLPFATDAIIPLTGIVLALCCLFVIYLLHDGYVHQLAENLRNGTLDMDEIETGDPTTRGTVALTRTALERDKLLDAIERFKHISPVDSAAQATYSVERRADSADPVVQAVNTLRSGDPARISTLLQAQNLTPALLPHVIPLLAVPEVLKDVFRSCRPVASSCAGQLVDALLDPRQHPLIRRRLPLILGMAENQRAVSGLVYGLDDPDWSVRFRCADALLKIKRTQPVLKFYPTQLREIVQRELEGLDGPANTVTSGEQDPLRHIFNLLGLIYNTDAIDLCYQSICSADRGRRGTALEYLENQLPTELRNLLWPRIAAGMESGKSRRSLQEIAGDLVKSAGENDAGASSPTVSQVTRPADTRDCFKDEP